MARVEPFQEGDPRRLQFVWVKEQGDHGQPRPGIVIGWQYAPVRSSAISSELVALVAVAPFGTALLVEWVSADRLIGLRNPARADD